MFKEQEAAFKALKDNAKAVITRIDEGIAGIHRARNQKFRLIHLPGDESTAIIDVLQEVQRTAKLARLMSASRAANIPTGKLNGLNTVMTALSESTGRFSDAVKLVMEGGRAWSFYDDGRVTPTNSEEEITNLGAIAAEIYQHLDSLRNSTSALGLSSSETATDKGYEASAAEITRQTRSELEKATEAVTAIEEDREKSQKAIESLEALSAKLAGQDTEFATKVEAIVSKIENIAEKASDEAEEVSKSSESVKNSMADFESSLENGRTQVAQIRAFADELAQVRSELEEVRQRAKFDHERQVGFTNRVEELVGEAESMVSGATTAGLASAFLEERKRLSNGMGWALFSFVVGIGFLFLTTVLLAAYVFEFPLNLLGFDVGRVGETPERGDEITLAGVVARTVILLAPFWLTLFSSRRYRNLFDLRQQYTHKYSMAFSVDGFKQQAPKYAEEMAAWVFHVVSEPPVSVKSTRGMGDSPLPDLQTVLKAPFEQFATMGGRDRTTEGG